MPFEMVEKEAKASGRCEGVRISITENKKNHHLRCTVTMAEVAWKDNFPLMTARLAFGTGEDDGKVRLINGGAFQLGQAPRSSARVLRLPHFEALPTWDMDPVECEWRALEGDVGIEFDLPAAWIERREELRALEAEAEDEDEDPEAEE